MIEKKIELIKRQIENLEKKDFNLEAWKTSTKLVLERIFGGGSQKIREIDRIRYDLSSWTMRDTMGTSSTMDTCKKTGRAILEMAIQELEILGEEAAASQSDLVSVSLIRTALEEELKGFQLKELREMLSSGESDQARKDAVTAFLEKAGPATTCQILASILSHPDASSRLF